MPRLRLDVSTNPRQRVAVVARLTELHTRLQGARREALDRAIDIGLVLLEVPVEERLAVMSEAGFEVKSERSFQDYLRLAEHRDFLAQRAASSIRHALNLIRESQGTARKSPVKVLRLKMDNVSSPEELARTLGTVKGKSVSIEIRVTQVAAPTRDRRQPPLPFEP